MGTFYACTFIEKRAEVSEYNKGCQGKPQTIVHEPCNVTAPTLALLVKKIGDKFALAMDDLFLPDEDGETNRIGFNQFEDVNGNTLSERDTEEWKAGRLTVYLCDYDFAIEKRTVAPIKSEEFKAAGIKTH
jgi:hypothetical protein